MLENWGKREIFHGPRPEPTLSSCPEGSKDWYYTLFGYCFRKKYIQTCDWTYYYKVLGFKYTMDGNKCIGVYDDPNGDTYNDENETFKPGPVAFCGLCMRYTFTDNKHI